jgi:Uncharacterized protein conserved in bacteria
MANFKYEITQHIATLSTNGNTTKELNMVKYSNAPPKLDLRSWRRENGEEQLLKGLTLSTEEADILRDALNELKA